jgi:hypothetical protein
LPSSFGWIRLLREVQAEPLAGPSIRRRPVAFSDFCQDPPLFTSARRQGRKEAWIDGHDVARHDGVLPVGVRIAPLREFHGRALKYRLPYEALFDFRGATCKAGGHPSLEELMSLVVRFSPESLTSDQYDRVVHTLNEKNITPADGLDYELCFGSGDKMRVSLVWDSKEQFEAFAARLTPILTELGIDPGEPEVLEVHNIIKR